MRPDVQFLRVSAVATTHLSRSERAGGPAAGVPTSRAPSCDGTLNPCAARSRPPSDVPGLRRVERARGGAAAQHDRVA